MNFEEENKDEELNEAGNAAEETFEDNVDGDQAEAGSPEDNTDSGLAQRVKELEEEVASMKDKALRALAEAENTRRRAEKSQTDTAKFAISKFAKDLLEVSDNMRRAVEAIPKDQAEENDLIKNIIVGIEATEKSLIATFERNGIKKIEPTEGKFDPNLHEAMFETEDPSKKPGEIVQLIEPGFILNDRLLRPARVGVAKGSAGKAQNVDAEL